MHISVPTYDAQQTQSQQQYFPEPLNPADNEPTPLSSPLKRGSTFRLGAPRSPKLSKVPLPSPKIEKDFHELNWTGAAPRRPRAIRSDSVSPGTNAWLRRRGGMQHSSYGAEPSPRSGTPRPYVPRRTASYTSTTSESPVLVPGQPVDSARIHRPEGYESFASTGGLPPSLCGSVPKDALIPSPSSSIGTEELNLPSEFSLRNGLSNLFVRLGNSSREVTSFSSPSTPYPEHSQSWVFRRPVHLDDFPEGEEDPNMVDGKRVPDHLPSSPLCPRNPRYHGPSMPTGCPMHGKPRNTPESLVAERVS